MGQEDAKFKIGNVPWNKGTKGVMKGGTQTQFKKGHLPHQTLPKGTITIHKNNRGVKYKIYHTGISRYIPLHIHLWRENKGEIPKGFIIRFIDGNTMNCVIDNLECISRSENMNRNSYHRFGEDVAKTIQLRGALTRQINKHIKKINNEK